MLQKYWHYASIMPDALDIVLCSKLCRHNPADPSLVSFYDQETRFTPIDFHCNFSNSLIIHQVKTKKISTVKEVWIPGLN